MKRIHILVLFLMFVIINPKITKAEEIVYSVNNGIYTCSNTYGEVYLPDNIEYNGTEISMFCEFVNADEVLNAFNSKYSDILSYLNDNYNTPLVITYQNATEAYEILNSFREDLVGNNNYTNVIKFLKIYKNKERNIKIKELIDEFDQYTTTDQILEHKMRINAILPIYSEKFEINYYVPGNLMRKPTDGMNISQAVNYAATYAESPNPNYAYISGADCTNFVSQILDNSGVSQVIGVTQSFGWWHTNLLGKHVHSYTWTQANAFVNYWDLTYATNDFGAFSRNVQRGDVIGVDEHDTGEINHLGFVTIRSTIEKTHTKKNGNVITYYDFKVAQHTSNYNKWVAVDDNHWEETSDNQSNYFITRFH